MKSRATLLQVSILDYGNSPWCFHQLAIPNQVNCLTRNERTGLGLSKKDLSSLISYDPVTSFLKMRIQSLALNPFKKLFAVFLDQRGKPYMKKI